MSNEYTITGDWGDVAQPEKISEFTFILNDLEYTIPCVEHEQNGVKAALAAATVSLHQQLESVLYRLDVLEAQVNLLRNNQSLMRN